ncbi:FAD-dependent oxidoreductase [Primorskyibacter aestuariivivens]|uniref:FAD-dependent oxidoreductase n=1 Tax=Primorskyibacter aestuariivivens TaxID=1888912 RepID=UPI0022FFE90E|nr:FAD-dependent oxidoreductase [Primorskyibacter aestuariivivens]MDA7430281.1 FAD-dependent oxidoreductase [Primorskyibacter aestuariivivens]
MSRETVDYVILGGGFYGCCLALFLRSISRRVMIVEAGERLLDRSSRGNQARVHTGFHYPRSALTAVRSMILHKRFARDFPEAIFDDFQMLYAVARRRSMISAKRFFRMFRDMGAPIERASPQQSALFDGGMIEDVFACREVAFDHCVLRELITHRLASAGIDVRLETAVADMVNGPEHVVVGLSSGGEVVARHAFNVTYARLNTVLDAAGLPRAPLKFEVAEIALVEPPAQLRHVGITVMDGPFFSCMPYPADHLHSLTHVRYTPHESWTDEYRPGDPYDQLDRTPFQSRVRHMIMDSQRYVPSLSQLHYKTSLREVKTVLMKNEDDDGRPILFQRNPVDSRVISVLGSKIDNIYDLFDLLRRSSPAFSEADTRFLLGRA